MALTAQMVDLTSNTEKRVIRNKSGDIAKVGGQLNRRQYEPLGSETSDAAGDVIIDLSATYSNIEMVYGPWAQDTDPPQVYSVHTQDVITHGAVTGGPFVLAETITGGTSAATGKVTGVGSGFLNFVVLTGTFVSGEVLTGGTSAATATSTAVPATATAVTSVAFRVFTASTGLLVAGAITFSYEVLGVLA